MNLLASRVQCFEWLRGEHLKLNVLGKEGRYSLYGAMKFHINFFSATKWCKNYFPHFTFVREHEARSSVCGFFFYMPYSEFRIPFPFSVVPILLLWACYPLWRLRVMLMRVEISEVY